MKVFKVISVLAIFVLVFVTSCSKIEPLTEKRVESVDSSKSEHSKAMMIDNGNTGNSEDNGITDPDHDEEHDKDEAKGAKDTNGN